MMLAVPRTVISEENVEEYGLMEVIEKIRLNDSKASSAPFFVVSFYIKKTSFYIKNL